MPDLNFTVFYSLIDSVSIAHLFRFWEMYSILQIMLTVSVIQPYLTSPFLYLLTQQELISSLLLMLILTTLWKYLQSKTLH